MSELSNPIFNNEREFLERQKEEYKSALMGDVDHIKSQGQEIGKKAAIAGGVLLAGYLLKRMFSGGKKKAKAVKASRKKSTKKQPVATPPVSTPVIDYDSIMHEQEDHYTISSERMHHTGTSHPGARTGAVPKEKAASEKAGGIMDSQLAKVLTQQAVAFLLVYAGKKVEEYLQSVSENNDIAAKPVVEVTQIETTEYIVPEENAI